MAIKKANKELKRKMVVEPDSGGSVVCREGQTRKEALAEQLAAKEKTNQSTKKEGGNNVD